MANKDTKKTIQTGTPKISTEEKNKLKQFLLNLPEEKAKERYTDKQLDREQEKKSVLKIGEISIAEVRRNIQSMARPYAPMFPIAYFREIYRLFGFPAAEADKYYRRREVAMFTRQVIYGRFDKGILMSLHVLNPYTGFIRRNYKHFQFMTDEGIATLAVIINEAIDMMRTCSSILEFRKKWYRQYGVPYQTNMFD